jgi:hypothetical protein
VLASNLTHWDVVLSVVASIVLISGSVLAVVKWGHNQVVKSVKEELGVVHQAVTPNGGSSLRDSIDRIEKETMRQGKELDRQGAELDDVSKRLERHLGFHEGQLKISK